MEYYIFKETVLFFAAVINCSLQFMKNIKILLEFVFYDYHPNSAVFLSSALEPLKQNLNLID